MCSFTPSQFGRTWSAYRRLTGSPERFMRSRSHSAVFTRWPGAMVFILWTMYPALGDDTNSPAFSRDQIEFYEKQVQPILAENCYRCHSHGSEKIKAGFVLASRPGLLKGGEPGPAIVPGAPEKSLLIKAVRHENDDLQMPPKKKLPDKQIATLAEWIAMGAPYSDRPAAAAIRPRGKKLTAEDRKWWAFQPVRAVKVPKVKDRGW